MEAIPIFYLNLAKNSAGLPTHKLKLAYTGHPYNSRFLHPLQILKMHNGGDKGALAQ